MKTKHALLTLASAFSLQPSALAFEGRIQAVLTRGGETQTFLYTVGTNQVRLERGETNWPHAKNIVALDTAAITLLFPHNRSFVRLKNVAAGVSPASEDSILPPGFVREGPLAAGNRPVFPLGGTPGSPAAGTAAATPPIGPTNLPGVPAPAAMPAMPTLPQPPAGLPPGIGPQPGGAPGLSAGPRLSPGMPAMPMMPMMPGMTEQLELKATGEKTNLLGCACARYEIKRRGEVMEIWATDKLLAFQPWLANQPPRFGPRMIEEQWGELLKAKKLFPLRAVLKFENGPERLRFEVKAIAPERVEDRGGRLFQPPPDYHEIEPLPF
jgi:hypothetical protein